MPWPLQTHRSVQTSHASMRSPQCLKIDSRCNNCVLKRECWHDAEQLAACCLALCCEGAGRPCTAAHVLPLHLDRISRGLSWPAQ